MIRSHALGLIAAFSAIVACSSDKKKPPGTEQPITTPDGAIANDDAGAGWVPTCMGTATSLCGKPQSIVRVVAKLGDGMPDETANVVVTQSLYRLGMGSSGGVWHTSGTTKGAKIGATTPVEVIFDMCAGGEMFSEDNCEYNLWSFVDRNVNGVLDQGEPAGHIIANVSCNAPGMQCFGIVLDCTNGMPCVAFQDPGICKCAMQSCNSAIKTCN
jgi:hypothetical protein